MKKFLKIIAIVVSFVVLIVFMRIFFIDYALVGTDKFSPTYKNGDLVFVCLVCGEYTEGDYILVEKSPAKNYSLFKITEIVDGKTIKAINGNKEEFEIQKEKIRGKLF